MKKIGVYTSGGDAPGMNACIRAVVRTALKFDMEVMGIGRGYRGMIENDIFPLYDQSVSSIIHQGGTILRAGRCDEFRAPEGRQQAYENLKSQGIEAMVAIGGDGTFTGANIFMSEYPDIRIVGCPGTIDNDLYGTDFTIGYDTAINTAMNAIDNIKDTADAHDRLFFIEVMGRDAGYIALRAGISTGAEAILVPESKTSIDSLILTLEKARLRKKNSSIVVVAEGDDAGGAFKVAELVKNHFTHYEIRVAILGHIQRGGRPTCMDRVRATRLGMEAVKALVNGRSGVMIGELRRDIIYTPFEAAIKHHEDLNPVLFDIVNFLG